MATIPSATPPVTARTPGTKWSSGKISIAAATVIGVITFAAFLFLAIWYIRREKRARRQRQLHNLNQDAFCPSSLSLAEETSRVLDEFLMKDIEPERTSLMFSRSRSPSMTFVVDNAEARSPTSRFYRTSYEASTNSLSKLDSLTRVSTEGTRPSLVVSETSQPQSKTSTQAPSSSSPRASVCSARATSPRSSQLYPTISATTNTSSKTNTTNTTEMSSIFSQGPTSSRTSTSAVRGANIPNTSIPLPSTNTSRTSSQLSRSSPRHSGGRVPRDGDKFRQGQVRSHRLSQSTVISGNEESLAPSESPQLPSIPSTPSPLFRFSEA